MDTAFSDGRNLSKGSNPLMTDPSTDTSGPHDLEEEEMGEGEEAVI